LEEYLESQGSLSGSFFVWTTAIRKILMLDNLRKKNVVVVEWCYMCKKSGESIDHLLIHCAVAIELWSSILCLFGVDWVMPRWVIDLLVSWRGHAGARCNYGSIEVGSIVFNAVPVERAEYLEL
jgi:hypothetical protein